MARGAAPRPTALKILEGAQPCRINRDEPQLEVKAPPCPPGLKGLARKEWKRVCAILTACRVLTEADCAALALYCQCWQTWCEAEKDVATRGQVLTRVTQRGGVIDYSNPSVTISYRAAEQMRRLMQELGLTPAARTRIKVEGAKDRKDEVRARDRGAVPRGVGGGESGVG